jgi:hypothetical protein
VVALYYVLPLDRPSDAYLVVELAIGVALLAGMIAWQVRAILRSAAVSLVGGVAGDMTAGRARFICFV